EQRGGLFRLIFASLFFGAALSTKWIGLAFLAAALLLSLRQRKFGAMAILIAGSLFAYVTTFFIFFGQFSGGFLTDRFSFDAVPALAYPKPWDVSEAISFLPSYTEIMYRANYSVAEHRWSSRPWQWPLGQGIVGMWDRGTRSLVLGPNIVGWGTVCIGVIFAGAMFVYRRLPQPALFALAGYGIGFLPFFIIGRPFFLYHYFIALTFGWLLAPWALGQLKKIIAPQTTHRRFFGIFFILLGAGFLLAFRHTYGI
ncbi:MAG: hypothetical protein AAB367_04020, partial [Patescibacteria group bacterium]